MCGSLTKEVKEKGKENEIGRATKFSSFTQLGKFTRLRIVHRINFPGETYIYTC